MHLNRSMGALAGATALAVAAAITTVVPSLAAPPAHVGGPPAHAHGHGGGLPDQDRRYGPAEHRPSAAQLDAVRGLGKGAQVRWNKAGTAHSVLPGETALSRPAGRRPDQVARSFLRQHRALFGLTPRDVAELRLTMEDTDQGLTFLRYQQVAGGREVYGATGLVVLDDRGRVVTAGSTFVPGAGGAPAADLSAVDAIRTTGAAIRADQVRPGARLADRNGKQRYRNTHHVPDYRAAAPIEADLVVVGTDDGPRTAWRVRSERASDSDYVVLVDAVSGDVLLRENKVQHDGPQGTVFPGDDPEAGGRGTVAFPANWVDAGGQTTAGNNTNTYQDAEGDNAADGDGSDQPQAADQHFDYAWADPWGNGTGAESDLPLTGADRDAVVTQLFYYTNWFHDYAYGLGFTETAKNFQNDNFGNGGSDGDAVEAESDANFIGEQCTNNAGDPIACRNNANFATDPDGTKPRMQMYVGATGSRFTQRANNRDTVIHEYTHGISGRIISDDNLQGGVQSGALGEGWSDALATSINDDPVYGEYNNGDYTDGIRSAAYDQHVRTYADMCQRATDKDGNPICQVHTDGELWAQMMWEARTALQAKYGAATGRAKHEQLMVLGMKLVPDGPSFADARNGYLVADWAMHPTGTFFVGQNACRLWKVFADNDLGTGSNDGDDVSSPTVSTTTPASCDPTAAVAPVADAPEGSDIAFDGTGSQVGGDPGDTLAYAWDLDGDGQYDDSTSATPTWVYGDNAGRIVGLRVTNSSGYTDTAEVSFATTNVAPTVQIDLSDLVGMAENETRTVEASFTDPGWQDTYTADVDLGTTYLTDPAPDLTVTAPGGKDPGDSGGSSPDAGSVTAQVTYGDNGTYTITVQVTDDDGGLGSSADDAVVSNVAPTAVIDESGHQTYDGVSAFILEAGDDLTVPAGSEDPGSDDLTFEWDWDGPVLTGETPDVQVSRVDPPADDPALSPSIEPRAVDLEATHAYGDACLYDLQLSVTDDDSGSSTDQTAVLVTGNADQSKGHGWWLNQYRQNPPNSFTDAELQCYLDIVGFLSLVFDEHTDADSRADAAHVLNAPAKAPDAVIFDQHALGAWLNFANGSIKLDSPVDSTGDGVPDSTFGDVMFAAESVRVDPTSTSAQVKAQKDVVERIAVQSAP